MIISNSRDTYIKSWSTITSSICNGSDCCDSFLCHDDDYYGDSDDDVVMMMILFMSLCTKKLRCVAVYLSKSFVETLFLSISIKKLRRVTILLGTM